MSNEKISANNEVQTVEPIVPGKGSEVIFSHSTFERFKAYREAKLQKEQLNSQPPKYFSRRV